MIGTIAPGFTVPGAATPFGMVQLSPDTEGPFAYSGYTWTDQLITGFSHVHLSGPGVPKAGDLPFMPTVGPILSSDPLANASPFNHATESRQPRLVPGPPEPRAASASSCPRRRAPVCTATRSLPACGRTCSWTSPATRRARTTRRSRSSATARSRARCAGSTRSSSSQGSAGRSPPRARGSAARCSANSRRADGPGAGGWVSFPASLKPQSVTVKVGVSFVDLAGARANLDAEVPGWDIAAVRAGARAAWNHALGAITVEGGTAHRPGGVHHGAVPLTAPPERLLGRRRPLPRLRRPDPPHRRRRPLRQLLVVGHLQGAEPVARARSRPSATATWPARCSPTRSRVAASRAGASRTSTPAT